MIVHDLWVIITLGSVSWILCFHVFVWFFGGIFGVTQGSRVSPRFSLQELTCPCGTIRLGKWSLDCRTSRSMMTSKAKKIGRRVVFPGFETKGYIGQPHHGPLIILNKALFPFGGVGIGGIPFEFDDDFSFPLWFQTWCLLGQTGTPQPSVQELHPNHGRGWCGIAGNGSSWFLHCRSFLETSLGSCRWEVLQKPWDPLAGCRENIQRLVAWHIRFGKPKREPVVGRMTK